LEGWRQLAMSVWRLFASTSAEVYSPRPREMAASVTMGEKMFDACALSSQTAGFTLEEIGELLKLDAGQDRARARELAKSRIDVLERKIVELLQARDALKRLASECAEGATGPCPILTSFDNSQS
jgi:hypothetical protein